MVRMNIGDVVYPSYLLLLADSVTRKVSDDLVQVSCHDYSQCSGCRSVESVCEDLQKLRAGPLGKSASVKFASSMISSQKIQRTS
jgi:hypothetical protein